VLAPNIVYAPVRITDEERKAGLKAWQTRLNGIGGEQPIDVGEYLFALSLKWKQSGLMRFWGSLRSNLVPSEKRASLRGEGGSQTGSVMSSRMLNNVTLNPFGISFNQRFATF
jgi:hypothetical protein